MRRRRDLTGEERRLWANVARSAIPLRGRRAPDLPPVEAVAEDGPTVSKNVGSASMEAPAVKPARKTPPAGPALHPIERPLRRKLAKGRVPLDARIDLHDKTQVVAHYALLGFLRQAQAQGMRHVLVITGRGASFGSRGILRRAVPLWFDTPEFRSLVAGFEPADRAHGGEGAIYVRVRRRA